MTYDARNFLNSNFYLEELQGHNDVDYSMFTKKYVRDESKKAENYQTRNPRASCTSIMLGNHDAN